uniref:Uncharacterized protein n=1 Tax=Tanacetum cinerariifolium TaxID=118510 RepID=A0A6L2KEL2_TANCI|nr:hypothetical protein [Tanacetum cinerariifolium]
MLPVVEHLKGVSLLCKLMRIFIPVPTVLSFSSAEYTRDRDRANCLNTSAYIDCRSSCTKTQDLDRMPVETITVSNQQTPVEFMIGTRQPKIHLGHCRHSQDMPFIQINSPRLQSAKKASGVTHISC